VGVGVGFLGDEAEEAFLALVVGAVRDAVEGVLVEDTLGALGLLHRHPVHADGQLYFALGAAALRLAQLLAELEFADALLDHLDPLRLVHPSAPKKLKKEITQTHYSQNLSVQSLNIFFKFSDYVDLNSKPLYICSPSVDN